MPKHACSVFGDRLAALASLLVGKYRLSKRLVKDALSIVRDSQAVNADETGFVQGREGVRAGRAWLWVVATARVVVFHIARSRGSKVARHLLGEDFAGLRTSDRWSAYAWVDEGLRQLCWAHLTRDFQGFSDREGRGGRIGRQLMRERDRFFKCYPPFLSLLSSPEPVNGYSPAL